MTSYKRAAFKPGQSKWPERRRELGTSQQARRAAQTQELTAAPLLLSPRGPRQARRGPLTPSALRELSTDTQSLLSPCESHRPTSGHAG